MTSEERRAAQVAAFASGAFGFLLGLLFGLGAALHAVARSLHP